MKPTEGVPSYGKTTKYRGIEFKSQCEARWAAMFDLLRIQWEYEPMGESTFPDFSFVDVKERFLEVKGAISGSPYSPDNDQQQHVRSEWTISWLHHPDAAKARKDAHEFCLRGRLLVVGCGDGYLWVPKTGADVRESKSWSKGSVASTNSEQEYYWPRTKIMVTGRGKL